MSKVTEKQAKEKHSGPNIAGHDSPLSGYQETATEVTSLVMYVREDVAANLSAPTGVEVWAKPLEARSENNNDSLEVRLQKVCTKPAPCIEDTTDFSCRPPVSPPLSRT